MSYLILSLSFFPEVPGTQQLSLSAIPFLPVNNQLVLTIADYFLQVNCFFVCVFPPLPPYPIDLREGERLIGCLLYMCQQGLEPAT